jgi:hypothetical protein
LNLVELPGTEAAKERREKNEKIVECSRKDEEGE